MPAPAMFDTHLYITKLTAVGMPEQQAEVLAEEQKQLLDTHLATKDDVKEATKELATKKDVLQSKHDIVKWLFGAAAALIVALFGLLHS